ncbi:hypothetical protein MVEN_00265800 [Mycena venus]|uniref:Uncharacterized protein n=1 Tax=Mycena venus TaxID=2733690 RepID=A0A8H7DDW6_9AGAR|nr:hypothetical protein MVEN_00265800 [Mycena venus]
MVHVGTAGPANLGNHKTACKPSKGKTQKISDLFARKPRANLVPSTVSSAPLVDASTSSISAVGDDTSFVSSPSREPSPEADATAFGGDASVSPNYVPPEYPSTSDITGTSSDCVPNEAPTPASNWPLYNAFDNLRFKMEQIPASLTGDALAVFAGNPADYFPLDIQPAERDKLLHALLERVFGSHSWKYNMQSIRRFLYRGADGLDAFCTFFEYFVCEAEYPVKNILDIILFLEEGIDSEFPDGDSSFDTENEPHMIQTTASALDAGPRLFRTGKLERIFRPKECRGWMLMFPEGKNAHTSYPFGLHAESALPWGYEFLDGSFFLRADTCLRIFVGEEAQCESCTALPSNSNLQGILDRLRDGVHENSRLIFHPIANLVELNRRRAEQVREKKLLKLNDTRTVMRKMTTIDNQKELTMAIASGEIMRVNQVLCAGYRNGAGTKGLLELCRRAARGEYKPLNDEREMFIGLTLLRVAGARVAEIGHRALGLPSVTTLRRNTVIRPLLPSAGRPLVKEIEYNIDACLDAYPDEDDGRPRIVHQTLIIDEMATERRGRYDDRTNKVVGVCRAHEHKVPLEVETEHDLNTLCAELKKGSAHLAGEATVAALGTLSANPRQYNARPILFSADCKNESGPEHAVNVLRPLITAINNKSKRGNTTYRLLCAASDGESRRGKAFVIEFMKRPLAPESPIFPLLSGLEFMNFLVGDDDMTADKDAKHALKCLRNLTMRDAGIKIRGFRITPAIIKEHLRANGLIERSINALQNPNDKQDVILAFSLLKALWDLPDAPPNSSPIFRRAREALKIFGKLGYFLIMPYVCVDLDLATQLTYLSAAAHLLLDLFAHDNARTSFMPVQTFVNLMIMIKNVFFCVAKTKVDIPDGKFWLILLGTDRLEVLFGLIRSAVGPDSNVDLLQLASRSSGLCEIAVIMALHPEWDRAPRRLKLPAIGEAGTVLDSKFDHLNPTSWKGNTDVRHVTPLTCWIRGRHLIEEFLPDSRDGFERLARRGGDMLSPCGKPLVEIYDEEDVDAAYASLELEARFPLSAPTESPESEPTYAGDDDLEDAMGVEEPRGGFAVHMQFNGAQVSKAKALRLAMAGLTGPRASTDRTRRVASIPCYQDSGIFDDESQILGGPCLRINHPICTLVRCEEQLFLAIGSVNGLTFGSEKLQEVGLDLLADRDTKVSFEIMCLVRTTVEDDPTERHDWRWSHHMDKTFVNILGRLVQPLNPTLSIRTPSKPTYLFESSELMAFGATLLERLSREDLKHIPSGTRTESFPYRFQGKACFLCEHDSNGRSIDPEPQKCCSKCTPPVPLDISQGQRILEHCGAHLLYDSSINRQHEHCGLCMRPTPMCVFYLKKSNGKPQIDWDKSTCLLKVSIRYAVAAESSSASPCSNVSVICTLCGPKRSAVWKYNLEAHFRNVHQLHNPQSWPMSIGITDDEKTALKKIWDSRQEYPRPRNMKKKKNPLVISEAHSSRLAFRAAAFLKTRGDRQPTHYHLKPRAPLVQWSWRGPYPPAAVSDDDDDMPPPSLLLQRRRAVHRRIESEDETEDDHHQPLPRDASDLGTAQADGLQDEDIGTPLTTPQEIEQELAEIGKEPTVNVPIEAHNSSEPTLQTVEEQTVPAKRTRRAAKLLNLGGCDTCQQRITDAEKNDRSLVAECSKKGCETRWVGYTVSLRLYLTHRDTI